MPQGLPEKYLSAVAALLMFASCAGTAARAMEKGPPGGWESRSPEPAGNALTIEFIELKRRNWESHGTDIRIDKDGSFNVVAVYLGKKETVREGTLSPGQMRELSNLVVQASFYDLPGEYKGAFQTEWGWWGYDVTIRSDRGTKTVRFHSEDETVPEELKRLVKTITEAAQ